MNMLTICLFVCLFVDHAHLFSKVVQCQEETETTTPSPEEGGGPFKKFGNKVKKGMSKGKDKIKNSLGNRDERQSQRAEEKTNKIMKKFGVE